MAVDGQKTAKEWLQTISKREKQLKKSWLDRARKIVEIYDDAEEKKRFNILYSNTETLLPALYNNPPRPEVQRRYTARNPQERQLDAAISQVAERTLEYLIDTNDEEYESFDAAVQAAVFDSLVPGQGQVRVRYKSEKGYQAVCWEHLAYDRFLWAFARKWEQVPWVAFGHDMVKEKFDKTFPEFVKTPAYAEINWEELGGAEETGDSDEGRRYGPTVLVWEVHEAETQKIYYVSDVAKEDFLLREDYPCDLSSRFPCPKPLHFVTKTSDLVPKPLYTLYASLSDDLDDVTRRLARVIRAIKVRGVYNSQIAEIERVLEADDNALIPSQNANSLFTEKGGVEANIWMLPIEQLVKVAQQLYVAQGNLKQTIFEMMGIADIQRGSTAAGETAAAQSIKDKWSSVRLKRSQKEVAKFCRSLLRIGVEMAGELFTPATLAAITRLPFQREAEVRAQMQQMLMQARAQGQQLQSLPPPPITWEQISASLKNQLLRTYRIDVETNSTIDLEATEDKEQIAEFMNGFGQMMAGFKPMVMEGVLDGQLVKEVMLEVTKRYRFGRRIETVLEQMQAPQPPQDDEGKAKLEKMAAEHARGQAQLQGQLLEAKGQIEVLQIQLAEAKVGGKLRENELTADFAGKLRSKDLQMADKAIDTRFKQAAAELKRMQDAISQQLTGATQSLQEAKIADPVLRETVGQQLAAVQQMQEGQAAVLQGLNQLARVMAAPRRKTLIEDENGEVIGVDETIDLKEQG